MHRLLAFRERKAAGYPFCMHTSCLRGGKFLLAIWLVITCQHVIAKCKTAMLWSLSYRDSHSTGCFGVTFEISTEKTVIENELKSYEMVLEIHAKENDCCFDGSTLQRTVTQTEGMLSRGLGCLFWTMAFSSDLPPSPPFFNLLDRRALWPKLAFVFMPREPMLTLQTPTTNGSKSGGLR